ncbi:MAG TPA: tyrosine-type recombinase/integrase [Ktedonobacterales bacterium]
MRLTTALEDYRYATLDLSPRTRQWYEEKLRTFQAWAEASGTLDIEDVTPAHVRRYLAYLRENPSPRTGQPRSSYTVRGHAQVIKGFLSWCAREDLISERIAKRVDLPRVEQKVIETFSPDHLKRLFSAAAKEMTPALIARDRAILSVLLDTGVRASELCGLTLDNTHLSPDDAYLKVYGKGRKEREVGLGVNARTTLHRYLNRHRDAPAAQRHVFLTRYHQLMTVNGLDQLLYRLADWAGVEGVRCSAHTFRHTYAVSYLAAGGDLYKLSRLLGHTSVSTTEHYLRSFSQRDARKGLSVLDSLGS